MKFASVCSGIEAASVALSPLGWKASFLSEIAPFPRAVLKHHYPDTPLHGDFTTIKGDEYEPARILMGGTPCQDFSVAGLRAGVAGERGNLTLEFARLADRLRTPWLLFENVPGILSADGGRAFGIFLGLLGQLGYGFAYRVLDAQYAGLAQRRERLFLIGYSGDWRPAAAVLFEPEGLCGNPAPGREKREDITGTLSARTEGGGGLGTDFECQGGGTIAHTLQASDGGVSGKEGRGLISHTLRAEGFDASEDGSGRGTPLVPEIAWALQERDSKGPDSNTKEGHLIPVPILEAGARTGKSTDDPRAGIGIGQPGDPMFSLQASKQHAVAFDCKGTEVENRSDGVTPTLRAMGPDKSHANAGGQLAVSLTPWEREGLRVQSADSVAAAVTSNPAGGTQINPVHHSMAVRRLTPRECERLMGFPDDYTLVPYGRGGKPAADGPRYRALGNSWAVPEINWLGRRIDFVDKLMEEKNGEHRP